MRVISISRFECSDIHDLSDAYVDNELLVETNLQVLRHLRRCPACRGHVDAKIQTKRRVRAAVRGTGVTPSLSGRLETMFYRR